MANGSLSGFSDLEENDGSSVGLTGFSGLGSLRGFSQEPEEPERGLVGTLLREIGRDIEGAAKTAVSPFGSAAEAFGLNAPITMEDLETRDLTGAAMVASMFVGGAAAQGIRGAKAGVGARAALPFVGTEAGKKAARTFAKDIGFAKSAAITASAEASAGAFFGAVRGEVGALEQGEDRLEAIISDAALFGGLGGGFSMMGSAFRATVGTKLTEIKTQAKNAFAAQIAQREEARTVLQEFAGVKLNNPETGMQTAIRRMADGSVSFRGISDESTAARSFDDFGTAIHTALKEGFTERLGPAQLRVGELKALDDLDPGVLREVRESGGEVVEALGELDLAQYQGVRDWAQKNFEQTQELAWLGAEAISEKVGPFGAISLKEHERRGISSILEGPSERFAQMDDGQLVREALKQGRLSLENLADGANLRDHIKEIFVNDQILGEGVAYVAMPAYDVGFLSNVLTPQTIAKIHPEVRPIFDLADASSRTLEQGHRQATQFMSDLKDTFPTETIGQVARIVDENVVEGSISQSREAALQAARETGDDSIVRATEIVTDKLNHQRLRLVGEGRLGNLRQGRPGVAQAAQRAEESGRALPKTMTEWESLANEGKNPTQDLLFHVSDAPSLERRDGKIWLSGDNPVGRPGNVFMIDRRKLDPDLLGESNNFLTYDGDIPENAFVKLGERGPRSEFRFSREAAIEGVNRLEQKAAKLLDEASSTPDPRVERRAREIISEAAGSTRAGVEAERAALELAQREGVGDTVERLLESAGREGYFPISHQVGNWRLNVEGVPSGAEFQLIHTTKDSALKELDRVLGEHGAANASVVPNTFSFDGGTMNLVEGGEFGKMVQAIRNAQGVEMSAKEAAELLKEGGTLPTAGGPRQKFSRFLQERRLGWREFTEDPYRTLEFYLFNTERTLAFNQFERNVSNLIEQIPQNKSQLKAWAENYRDRLLGRPTRSEEIFQNTMEFLSPHGVAPRALKRYSSALRRWTSFSRLGGAMSGIVNSTQIAVNTAPLIGARWTGEGLKKIMTPGGLKELNTFFAKNEVDLGLHMSLSREGKLIGGEGVKNAARSALKRAKLGEFRSSTKAGVDTLERMWLFAFNGAERLNRAVTAWGSYQKGIKELNMSKDGALAYAREMTEKTQFNYRQSNIPTLLQGPLGGLIGQFKTFFINEVELIASVDNATRAKMMAAFTAVGGLSAITELPGADIVDWGSEALFDRKISEALRISGGEEDASALTRAMSFGAPGLFANVDLSNYVGPGGFFELTRGWAGPFASDAAALGRFAVNAGGETLRQGSPSEATLNQFFQQAVPSQIRRIQRGLDIVGSGEVRNPYTKKLLYRPTNRMRAGAMQALGPPTTRMSAEREVDALLSRQAERYNKQSANYGRQIGLAASRGANAELRELLAEARGRGLEFSPADVRRWAQNMTRSAAERRERRTPLALREDLETLFDLSAE